MLELQAERREEMQEQEEEEEEVGEGQGCALSALFHSSFSFFLSSLSLLNSTLPCSSTLERVLIALLSSLCSCTFENAHGGQDCEICGLPLAG